MVTKVLNLPAKRSGQPLYGAYVIKRNEYGKRRDKSVLSTAIFERPTQKAGNDDAEE